MNAVANLTNAYRSEWILLNRRRLWTTLVLTTIAFAVAATTITLMTVADVAGDNALALSAIAGAGGATTTVVFSVAFSAILVLAAFASCTGNEFSRGTLRAAMTRQPGRSSLIAGKLGARMTVAAALMLAALVVGAMTSAVVAPSQDIPTTGWFTLDALGDAVVDYGRLLLFVTMFAIVGTAVAVLVRSTPVALGICLLWFGPVENVIAEGQSWGQRWFPGRLTMAVLQPDAPSVVSTGTALATLGVYAAVLVVTIGVVMSRRDVTA